MSLIPPLGWRCCWRTSPGIQEVGQAPVRPTWRGAFSHSVTGSAPLAFFVPLALQPQGLCTCCSHCWNLDLIVFIPAQALFPADSSAVSQWKVLGEDGWAGGQLRYFFSSFHLCISGESCSLHNLAPTQHLHPHHHLDFSALSLQSRNGQFGTISCLSSLYILTCEEPPLKAHLQW